MTKIYLAGPMSGKAEFNFSEFFEWTEYLQEKGYEVFSPAEHDIQVVGHDFSKEFPTGDLVEVGKKYGLTHRVCLKADMDWICDNADAMFMMSGWEKSIGAKAEHALALALGIPVYYENTI